MALKVCPEMIGTRDCQQILFSDWLKIKRSSPTRAHDAFFFYGSIYFWAHFTFEKKFLLKK